MTPPGFLDALHAEGPAADREGKMDLYGWLVGSWELDVTRYLEDGSQRRIAAVDAWHIQWTEPVSQSYSTMIGRKQGNNIVQDGKDAAGNPIRWSFTEITPNSFRWLGETSRDGGTTWRLDVEFLARRTG
jgi:hypothetical protein